MALLMGLPLFFLLKDSAGTSLAAMAMIVVINLFQTYCFRWPLVGG